MKNAHRAGATDVALGLVPGALTLYLGLVGGGYPPGATAAAAAVAAVALALWIGLSRRPLAGMGAGLAVAAAALALLAGWTLASSLWSHAPARADSEYVRAVLYLLVLLFCGLTAGSARRLRVVVYGITGAIVALCAVALVARTLPELILDRSIFGFGGRLAHPLVYWNTLALIAGIGIVLCGHMTCDTREPRATRVLAAAAIPLLATVLYYTFSRGPTWVTVGALGVYLVVARPRALLCGVLATAPAVVVCMLTANPPDALTDGHPLSAATVAAGRSVFVTVVIAMLVAAALRAALLPLDRRLERVDFAAWLRRRLGGRRRVVLAASGAACVLVVGAVVAAPLTGTVRAKVDTFSEVDGDRTAGAGASRLFDVSSNGRGDLWGVAEAGFRDHPLRGDGAGTFGLRWQRDAPAELPVENAHSLYLELLSELGLPGLVLAATVLLLMLAGFARRARGPDRALFAALLAAGLAWAVHAGVDWDWEMPVATLWLFALGGVALARAERPNPGTDTRWALRVAGVLVCLAVAVLPARVALSEARIDGSLAAMERGDCEVAVADARRALDAHSRRPLAHQVIGYCALQDGQPSAAVAAYGAALAADPRSADAHYALAVARATAGLDPRPEARLAARLSPLNPVTVRGRRVLRGDAPQAWRREGRNVILLPPAERHE